MKRECKKKSAKLRRELAFDFFLRFKELFGRERKRKTVISKLVTS